MTVTRVSQLRRLLSGTLARVAMSAALVLHVGVTTFAPIGDARVEAQSAGSAMHVEESSSAECLPAHDHVACALCRSMHGGGLPLPQPPSPPRVLARTRPPRTEAEPAPRPRLHAPQSPRAPPQG